MLIFNSSRNPYNNKGFYYDLTLVGPDKRQKEAAVKVEADLRIKSAFLDASSFETFVKSMEQVLRDILNGTHRDYTKGYTFETALVLDTRPVQGPTQPTSFGINSLTLSTLKCIPGFDFHGVKNLTIQDVTKTFDTRAVLAIHCELGLKGPNLFLPNAISVNPCFLNITFVVWAKRC